MIASCSPSFLFCAPHFAHTWAASEAEGLLLLWWTNQPAVSCEQTTHMITVKLII